MAQELATRDTYGRVLAELGHTDPNIVALDSDLSKSTMTKVFAKEFPDRFFDCGIAEQNMIGIAAGLAASGKTVFASTFAVFATSRCFDQLRMGIAQPKRNVKVVATHGGITVGEDGFSHHAIEDFALACSLPNFTVVAPADAMETEQVIKVAARTPGPFYIRLARPKTPVIFGADYKFTLGKGAVLKPGDDATIISTGIVAPTALAAAQGLEQQGIHCRVLSLSTLKPLDEAAIVDAAGTGAVVTVEEHLEHGGLGSMVAMVLAKTRPVPMSFVAIKDTFTHSGKPEELLALHGFTADNIQRTVQSLLASKANSKRKAGVQAGG